MTWSEQRAHDVMEAYYRYYVLSGGDRVQRTLADEHWWAWEAVHDGVRDGTLPLDVLDGLLHHPDADAGFRAYIAAGALEEALTEQVAAYGDAIAARCLSDPTWAEAVTGVWVDDREWSALPEALQRLIPIPAVQQPERPRKSKAVKRLSKRQGKHPRHR